jgi:hypothetical protein
VVLVQQQSASHWVAYSQDYLDNDPQLRRPVLYAASQGADDVNLPDQAPGRHLYVLRPGVIQGPDAGHPQRTGSFHPIVEVRGRQLRVSVAARAVPGQRCLFAYVSVGDGRRQFLLTCDARPGRTYRHEFLIGRGGDLALPQRPENLLVTAGVAEGDPNQPGTALEEERISLGVRGDPTSPQAVALLPGDPWRRTSREGHAAWFNADSGDLAVEVTPA